jgi:hypothetical protein
MDGRDGMDWDRARVGGFDPEEHLEEEAPHFAIVDDETGRVIADAGDDRALGNRLWLQFARGREGRKLVELKSGEVLHD